MNHRLTGFEYQSAVSAMGASYLDVPSDPMAIIFTDQEYITTKKYLANIKIKQY